MLKPEATPWGYNPMSRIPSVVFDLDDTLLDNNHYAVVMADVARRVGELEPGLNPQRLHQVHQDIWMSNKDRYRAELWQGTMDTFSLAEELWGLALDRCGVRSPGSVKDAVRIHMEAEAEGFRLYEDARFAVGVLQRAGVRMALVTNGPSQMQQRKIELLAIAPWFESLLVSAEVGHSKPEPEIYTLALESLDADPKDAWFVGDNLYTDIAGANNLGMPSVWVNRTGEALPPDAPAPTHEVRTLKPLPGLMGLESPA